jgi:hypothetical protein
MSSLAGSGLYKWNKAQRVSLYGGVKLAEGYELKYGHDCKALYIPLRESFNPSKEELVTEAKANERLRLIPAATVTPHRYRVKVVVNPKLIEYAEVNCPDILEQDEDANLVVMAKFYRKMDLTSLDWLVKLYLIA